MNTRAASMLLGLFGVVLALTVWEGLARSGMVSQAVFPPPSHAVVTGLRKIPPADLANHMLTSVQRIAIGFSLGALLGIVLAILGGWYRVIGNLIRPVVELLRPIPPLAWIPMAIVWFGLGEPSKIFLIFLGAFFPVLTNAWKGMAGIDPTLLRAGQTMGLKGPELLVKVAIPAALPDIATGLRIGWGLAFGVLVAAELIAAESGLGYLIMNARQLGEVEVIILGILVIGALNLATDALLGVLLAKWMGKWQDKTHRD
ncbi:MAG: ABC transporter permease [Burkholderiales bacterium]|nr:ABC transporter permease [Burkholderiales bacterium]